MRLLATVSSASLAGPMTPPNLPVSVRTRIPSSTGLAVWSATTPTTSTSTQCNACHALKIKFTTCYSRDACIAPYPLPFSWMASAPHAQMDSIGMLVPRTAHHAQVDGCSTWTSKSVSALPPTIGTIRSAFNVSYPSTSTRGIKSASSAQQGWCST